MDFREKARNARAFIVLLAAFITELLNIKYKRELLNSMLLLLAVIIIFFVIATIAIRLIDKIRNMEGPTKNEIVTETTDEKEPDEDEDAVENKEA